MIHTTRLSRSTPTSRASGGGHSDGAGSTSFDSGLSDLELVSALQSMCVERRRLVADSIKLLVDLENRNLHARMACSSLHDFCQRLLKMSDSSAYRHMTAARMVRRFPCLLAKIENAELHLSSLVLLRDVLTESNVELVIEAASGKTTQQVEELVARLAPKPDLPTMIKRLPTEAAPDIGQTQPDIPAPAAQAAPAD